MVISKTVWNKQAHREGGVAGASAPGPGSPKGARRAPSKNKACVKKGEREAEMGRLKTVHQAQHASIVWSLTFFENGPPSGPPLDSRAQSPVAQWDPRPATCCWMTVKSRRPDQNPSTAKKQNYFKGVFFLIISLYCIVFLDFS